jgi:pimeloyl-ACP methyl ester carboxylesterase
VKLWHKKWVWFLLSAFVLAVAVAFVWNHSRSPRPDLRRLYQSSNAMMDGVQSAPVILIPGAFGSRLRDKITGEEIWPGNWSRILFSSYPELALDMDASSLMPKPSRLEPSGIAEEALQKDFYRPIIKTLTQYGGYIRTLPGTVAHKGERRFYVFSYDWRQDTVTNARALDHLIKDIQRDYQDPTLKVDLVAHSMGGIIARYYLRFGTVDVLDGTPRKIVMAGAISVRKLVLLGTPNLGSISSLQAFIRGEQIVFGHISPHTLATFPSGYQLFPHPLNDWLIDIHGKSRPEDLFDPQTWQRFGWSQNTPLQQVYFNHQLERARRLAWMLSLAEPVSPVRYVLFGGGCHLTPARLLLESDAQGREHVRLSPQDIVAPQSNLNYDDLMNEPGDSRVTKPSLLAHDTLDPTAEQSEDSFLPVAYAFFLCENHADLTSNINFQDNLLNVLLSRHMSKP